MQYRNKDMRSPAFKVAMSGVLVAIAMIFSYIETLIPFAIPIPGAKIGLANLVTLTGLFFLPPGQILLIMIARILLSGFMFGNLSSVIYSMAGGFLSFFVMLATKKIKAFSVIGVSILGGVSHNIGQLAVACLVLSSTAPAIYLPYLIVVGSLTGALIGIIGHIIYSHS